MRKKKSENKEFEENKALLQCFYPYEKQLSLRECESFLNEKGINIKKSTIENRLKKLNVIYDEKTNKRTIPLEILKKYGLEENIEIETNRQLQSLVQPLEEKINKLDGNFIILNNKVEEIGKTLEGIVNKNEKIDIEEKDLLLNIKLAFEKQQKRDPKKTKLFSARILPSTSNRFYNFCKNEKLLLGNTLGGILELYLSKYEQDMGINLDEEFDEEFKF